ncbi:rhamnan synthesis F family protein [Sphingomonas fuzhouensis]|uniref:rhamnan synthesis F family protein n=1 Tax=Sphingomonas fuzhouensis TaxID=3106033 RepID=UPI002AFE3078|nr:rhamnan synthesis F family protein [Sphingomonas sp. SGZ-02]
MVTASVSIPAIDERRIRDTARLCLFAHYHQDGWVAEHTLHYLRALQDAGFVTVVLSTAKLTSDALNDLRTVGAEVILRENTGMDFGGWIEACMRFFPIKAQLLLLANDSVYGPLTDLSSFIDQLLTHDADFYGAVESLEIAPHLQSWFLLLRPEAYQSSAFSALMCTPMPDLPDKLSLVTKYEIGLSQRLVASGLRYHSAFSFDERQGIARRYPYNPAHLLWREIIDNGVPFLKVELLRLNRMRVVDTIKWKTVVASHAPSLVSMIQADLDHRGVEPLPRFGAMSAWPFIYWPELRKTVLSDYRSSSDGRGWKASLHFMALRTLALFAVVPRRVHARIIARRESRKAS